MSNAFRFFYRGSKPEQLTFNIKAFNFKHKNALLIIFDYFFHIDLIVVELNFGFSESFHWKLFSNLS